MFLSSVVYGKAGIPYSYIRVKKKKFLVFTTYEALKPQCRAQMDG
jgi:hypothetical protein